MKAKKTATVRIQHLEHGDPRLWELIGPALASREVHRELGGPMYSAPDTHWWVALDAGVLIGFASLRLTSSAAWIDYTYVVESWRGRGLHTQVAAARDAWAAQHVAEGLPLRVAVREARWHHYEQRGWRVSSRRGSWVHGVRP